MAYNGNPVSLFPNVYSKDGFIYKAHDKEDYPVATDICLDAIRENIDTGEVKMVLSTIYKGKEIEAEISRSELRKSEIMNLLKYGFDVLEANAMTVIQHIRNQEDECQVERIHSKVGFGTYDDTGIFRHYSAIGLDSKYCGNLRIKPKGSIKEWRNMVKNHVMGFTPLELALAIGFTAPVVGFIGGEISLDTILVHLFNDSTRGKTTALMLALSPFGCPDPKTKFSLANTWAATDNYLVASLNGNHGLPYGLDEASMYSNNANFTSLVYRLASNKDKGRLNKDSTLKETGEWGTVIISTGEFSLLSKCHKNKGLAMRVIDIGNVTWTPDAVTSESIKTCVLNNYGKAGLLFANKLLSIGKTATIELWAKWRTLIKNSIGDENPFADRTSAKLAPIMVAADIAGTVLELEFNTKEILQMLIDSENEGDTDNDIGKEAYDYFLEQFNKYRRHFGIPETLSTQYSIEHNNNGYKTMNYDIWGNTHIKPDKSMMEIRVIKSQFENLMLAGGFQDTKIILRLWKEKGLLDHEKDRNTRKIKLEPTGTLTNVYCIKYNLNDEKEALDSADDDNDPKSTTHRKAIPINGPRRSKKTRV